ncbi:hypothetical protein CKO32_01655 [Afifella marina DSM 2698]|nr:hypothetical protein [Afifella marina DSM 2698]MBK1628387.1 hypothetical protein [Afifella marina]MBK5919046.1 hypothetical protein [Afifella marina]RAI20215.1 hypothetical protein CH311_10340 [Afifella marina DSM 2698]
MKMIDAAPTVMPAGSSSAGSSPCAKPSWRRAQRRQDGEGHEGKELRKATAAASIKDAASLP